jgi:hypothetical protein
MHDLMVNNKAVAAQIIFCCSRIKTINSKNSTSDFCSLILENSPLICLHSVFNSMDKFLLQNVARYQELIRAFDPKSAPRTGTITAGATSPDMVVSARIRPLLKKDIVAGWPGAIFPRSDEEGVLDIHDLYNHPRGRPILKVRMKFSPSTTHLKLDVY